MKNILKQHKFIFFIPILHFRILYDLRSKLTTLSGDEKKHLRHILIFTLVLPLIPLALICAVISAFTSALLGIISAVYGAFTLFFFALVRFQAPQKGGNSTALYFTVFVPLCLVLFVTWRLSGGIATQYPDLNGAHDTSLGIITEENISDDSYWNWSAFGNYHHSENSADSLDSDYIEAASLRASGIRSVMKVQIKENEAWLFTAYMRINSGNARLYVLSPDKEILYEFTFDEDDGFLLENAPDGEYTLVLACESADFELAVGRKKLEE